MVLGFRILKIKDSILASKVQNSSSRLKRKRVIFMGRGWLMQRGEEWKGTAEECKGGGEQGSGETGRRGGG